MPRTLSFPPPSTATCPICAAALSEPRCGGCGASFASADGATLWRVDHDLFDLCRIRNDVVRRLLTDASTPSPVSPPVGVAVPSAQPPVDRPVRPPASASPPTTVVPARPGFDADAPTTPAPWSPLLPPSSADAPRLASAPPPATSAPEVPWSAPPTTGAPSPAPTGAPEPQHARTPKAARLSSASAGTSGSVPDPDDGAGQAPSTLVGGTGPAFDVPGAPRPPDGRPPARTPRPRPSFSAAEVLVALGALSLVAAVAVFAAVSWSDLAAWAQGTLIVGLTGAVLGAAVACRRRHLVATSESLGAVVVALGLADVQVARVGLDGVAPGRWVWAVGLGLVAAGALAVSRRTGIRVLGLAGGALAFAPLVVAASGSRPMTWVAALAVQAVVGGAVAARLADRRPDRAVAVVGAALSWCGAVAASLGLAATGLTADPLARPVGPALVIAALAVASVIGARRIPTDAGPADLVGGAGATLAFVPAVLLVLGFASPVALLAVCAAQALVALALATIGRLTPAERAVTLVGGALCWSGAAVGGLILAIAELFDGELGSIPLVLATLAVGSIVLGRVAHDDERDLVGAAGTALAFAPALLVAASTGSLTTVVAVGAAQALLALALATTGRLTPAERAVALVGGALCWLGAAAAGLVLATVELFDGDLGSVPLVLAALAVGSIVIGRMAHDDEKDLVGVAGTALAFAPALLVAAATGSLTTVVAVGAAEALLAMALATTGRLIPGERAVAVVGGAVCWVAAAIVGSIHGSVDALDGDAATSPAVLALILAALAGCSVVIGRRAGAQDDTTADPLGAAAVTLALVPALLVAAGTGSTVTVLAVAAAQAVIALALASWSGTGREALLTPVERVVAVGGGWSLWIASAGGALIVATVEIVRAPDDADGRLGSLLVLGGLAVASLVVGAATRRGELAAAGAGLAFLPVPLAVVGLETPTLLVGVLLGEALVAAVLGPLVRRGAIRVVLHTGGVTAWSAGVVGAGLLGLAGWLGSPVSAPTGSIALLGALAALAVGASLWSGWATTSTAVGLAAATVPVLLGVGLAAGGLGPDGWVAAELGAAAVLALGLAALARVDDDRPWVAPSLVALSAGAALAVVPARAVLATAAALIDRASTAPDVGAHTVVVDWLRPAVATTGVGLPGWAAVAQLAGAAGLAGAVALVLHRRVGRVLGTAVAVGAAVVVPVAAGLTVAVTVSGLGLVVLAAAAVVRLRPRDPELLLGSAAVVALGTAVALASAPWTVGWTVLVGLAIAGLAVEAAARRSPDAPVWVGAAVSAVLGGVALDAWVLGVDGIDGLLAVAIAAGVVSPVAAVLERRHAELAADVVDVLVGLTLVTIPVLALATAGTVFSLSPFVAVVGVTAAGAALRPRRRPAWLVATASAVLLVWLQAGRAEIDVVEAYTVPVAAWALLVGAVAGRRLGSWERFGIGLLAAAGPTTVLALIDPDPLRTVAVVALGTGVAVWGAAARLQAPLAVGAAAVGLLAVRHLGPVSVDLPRYVTFAVAGLVLLAVGATFEQRRQDLRQARDAFVRLR